MPHNNYFQFKQFRVEQNHAAMKVGTDGVLLGAWTNVENASGILDIGTGTGVIALMLAQRCRQAQIDAIDIEEGAIQDCTHNFEQSLWKHRLNVIHTPLQEFAKSSDRKYDSVVSNPPFFNNSLKSEQKEKALARHTETLSFDDLISGVIKLLESTGRFCVILPIEAEKEFQQIALRNGLYLTKITRVKPNFNKPCKRLLLQFEFSQRVVAEDELIIETEIRHRYTSEFARLVQPFYLKID